MRPIVHTQQPLRRLTLTAAAVALALGLAACGSKEEKKPASQVAAKVNSSEISVHQINYALTRAGANAANPEQAGKLRKEVLDKLIDQQLAVDQAIEKKLDRSPEVLSALEASRRDILARAYVESLSGGLAKPTEAEAREYYTKNPALFAERRIYNIQEIIVPAGAGLAGQVRDLIAAGKPMDDVARLLRSKDVKFGGGGATRPAEQIPLELLPKIHALKDGQGLVIENGDGFTAMRLVASQSQPVPIEQALPRIQQFLANQRAGEHVTKEMKALRDKAQITYVGDFANDAKPATAPAAAPAAKPAEAAAPASPAPAAPASADTKALEKGVKGLK